MPQKNLTSFQTYNFPTATDETQKFSPFELELDSSILKLLKECRMPGGTIELGYSRNPSFLSSLEFEGSNHQISFFPPREPKQEKKSPDLRALGVRSIRQVYLRGKIHPISYLHHLRIHPFARKGLLLSRGYVEIRKVSQDFPTACTLTSILADNKLARETLENPAPRACLPSYIPVCDFFTALIPLKGLGRKWPLRFRQRESFFSPFSEKVSTRFLEDSDHGALVSLFEDFGKVYDGAPVIRTNSNFSSLPQYPLKGIKITEFLGAFINEKLVGAIGLWNQTPWKQIIVEKFHPLINRFVITWNVLRRFFGLPPIFSEGKEIPHVLLDPWAVGFNNEQLVIRVLLGKALEHLRSSDFLFAAWGTPQNHPARPSINQFFHLPYFSKIFQVAWPETPIFPFDKEKFYLSLGTL
ncbi:hypothetical protein HYY75_06250 [bacterium]|nr:hypothetical protein [bacterium]